MKFYSLLILLCLIPIQSALADIYKRVDSQGHVTYSSEPIKGGKKLILKPLPAIPGETPTRRGTPEDFPKVDTQTQKSRDATRRIILEDELATEEKLLTTAKDKVKDLVASTPALVDANGIPFNNSAPHAESLKAAQDSVSLHEQNIKALRKEISGLK
jgi:hypothetical protein